MIPSDESLNDLKDAFNKYNSFKWVVRDIFLKYIIFLVLKSCNIFLNVFLRTSHPYRCDGCVLTFVLSQIHTATCALAF